MELTLEAAKIYLPVDSSAEDPLISSLIASSIKLCRDVARLKDDETEKNAPLMKTAVLYPLGYLYEHREEADHHELTMNLRSLLFPIREGVF